MSSLIQLYESLVSWISLVPTWQAITGILVCSLLLGKFLEVLINRMVPQIINRTESTIDDILVKRAPIGVYTSVLVGGAYLSLLALEIPGQVQTPVESVLLTMLVMVWTGVVVQVGREVSELGESRNHVDEGIIPIFKNIWTFLIGGSGIFVVLGIWGVNITPLLASASILGVAVGFAAKDTVANFFGSIALYVDGTYAVGDYIVLNSGEHGWVEDISIRSTQIRTRDDLTVTVPNSMLNSGKIINESTPTPKRRIRVSVGVDYESDVDKVVDVLEEVAIEEETVVETPQPKARLCEFGDSSLDFELLVWIQSPAMRPRVEHTLNRQIQQQFSEENISIPYPQRVLSDRNGGREAE